MKKVQLKRGSSKKPLKRRRTCAILPPTPEEAGWNGEIRDDHYAKLCRLAVKHGETDKMVRHLMAAGLANSPAADNAKVLAQDLNLLRWVLGKMEDNRHDAELRQAGIDV